MNIKVIEQDMQGLEYQLKDIIKKCTTADDVELIAGYIGLMLIAVTSQDKDQAAQCLETIDYAKIRASGKTMLSPEQREAKILKELGM